ncbi:MAG: MBL fold metallo-hydrolase [bacterium]
MSLKVFMLASGSGGNSILVQSGRTSLLIDAGLSGSEIIRRLESCGCLPERVKAILVTHEHSDHIKGVGILARKYRIPVYLTEATYQASVDIIKEIPRRLRFFPNRPFPIGDIVAEAFPLSHDAVDPVGFILNCRGHKLGIATDLGFATELVKQKLKGCQTLVIESNHDPEMLKTGPYPWYVKQRVRGRQGHLSNHDALELLKELVHDGLQDLVLAHISETNNHYQLVEKNISALLETLQEIPVNLTIAKQGLPVMVGG